MLTRDDTGDEHICNRRRRQADAKTVAEPRSRASDI